MSWIVSLCSMHPRSVVFEIMMFNLSIEISAQINQASLRQAQAQVQSSLGNIKGKVDLEISQRSLAQVRQLSGSLQDLQSNIQALRAASAAASTAVGRVSAAMSGVASQAQVAAGGIRTATAATRQSAVAAREAGDSYAEFGRQVGLSARRFAAFSVAAGGMYAMNRAIREGVSEAVNFDLQLNRLRQVSGETAGQVRVVGDEVMRLSTNLGASSKDLMEAAVTLKQAGLATSDVKKALEGIAQASLAPNFSSMKQITEGAVAGFQQFGKNIDQVKEQLGAMNAVAGDFAVEASDLVTVMQKAGGTAAQTGAQINELLAVFTAIRSTTRESADSIATGLRTIFTRLQRNDTVDALKSLGVNLRYAKAEADALGDSKLEGQFVGMYEAVRRLSEGLSKIRTSDPRFSEAIEELGGYRQVSRVIPMIQQFGEAQKALNVARLGSASLEAAAATRQDALATKFAKTKESFQQLVNELVQTRGFKNMVDVALTLANAFIEVTGALKPLLPLIVTLGAIKVGAGLFSFGKGVRDAFTAPVGSSFAPPPVQRSRFRFATGGVVPGVGSGDTVPAQLEPGEFVVRKRSAQKLGYDTLHAMNAGRVRYADGGAAATPGFVLNAKAVRGFLADFEKQTGVNYLGLVNKFAFNDLGVEEQQREALERTLAVRGRTGSLPAGSFSRKTGVLVLNKKTLTSEALAKRTLAHELGHAVDAHLGGGEFQSETGEGLTAQIAGTTRPVSGRPTPPVGGRLTPIPFVK
ncbi:MAG: Phage tail tape measure protein [Gemmataceae bacterium]|nr:Phage tail tape measure protein [Gemmataceae bacterium]